MRSHCPRPADAASRRQFLLRLAQLGFVAAGRPVDVSASFGVARVVDGKHPLSHALAAAEIACKAAKDRGRGRVEVFQESTRASSGAART